MTNQHENSVIGPARGAYPIVNHRTGQTYRMTSLDDDLALPQTATEQIVAICNQPSAYAMLFSDRLGSAAYALADAERFLDWARHGWRDRTHFVFLLLGPEETNTIVGALDIKSANRESAEIGYWLDAAHSGLMTNSVTALVSIAHRAGYAQLCGLVRETNRPSANVLTRAGFVPSEPFVKNDRTYYRFTRDLPPQSQEN